MIKTSFFGQWRLNRAIKKEVKKLKKMSTNVLVGYPEDSGNYDDGTSVVTVAATHEFGTDTIPKRPTLRRGVDAATPDIVEFITDQAAAVIEGKATPSSVMDGVGDLAVASVQQEIVDLKYPPILEKTKKARAVYSSNPLVDTGEMKGSVTFVISKERPTEGL